MHDPYHVLRSLLRQLTQPFHRRLFGRYGWYHAWHQHYLHRSVHIAALQLVAAMWIGVLVPNLVPEPVYAGIQGAPGYHLVQLPVVVTDAAGIRLPVIAEREVMPGNQFYLEWSQDQFFSGNQPVQRYGLTWEEGIGLPQAVQPVPAGTRPGIWYVRLVMQDPGAGLVGASLPVVLRVN
jgi:hypothetical protein